MELLPFCAFLNFHAFGLLLHRSFFVFYAFLIFFLKDFFSIFPRLCRSWTSAVLQHQTCNVFLVSHIKLRAVIFRVSPGVPFGRVERAAVSHRMRAVARSHCAVVPAARLVSIRDTSVRIAGTVQRWARGYSTTSVEKQSTAPREILLDCSVRSSFWTFCTLRRPRVGF